jgi:dihydroorotate dehydrogenase
MSDLLPDLTARELRYPPSCPRMCQVLLKLAPDLEDRRGFASSRPTSPGPRAYSGLVLCNTSKTLTEAAAGEGADGPSGPPLVARALECVNLARGALAETLLIGVGGVSS